jgi:hypothetical protein
MWNELKGTVKRLAGSGAYSTPFAAGTRILKIIFVGGTCVVPTGDGSTTQTITGITGIPFVIDEFHKEFLLGNGGESNAQLSIVFNGSVTSYYVEYIGPPGAS